MHFLVVGTGAIGGYFGARLLASGQQVSFIARGQQFKAIKEKGLTVESINGDLHLDNVTISEQINPICVYDVIIVAVKSYQLADISEQIVRAISEKSVVIPLLNGIYIDQLLVKQGVDKDKIITGFVNIIAQVAAPGKIKHIGVDPHITLGLSNAARDNDDYLTSRMKEVTNVFSQANISCKIKENIDVAVWGKYLFVAPWAALGSVLKIAIGEIRSQPEYYRQLHCIIDEYYQIALAHGVNVPLGVIQGIKKAIDSLPAQSKPSMQKDIDLGKNTEFMTLVGASYQLARKYQLHTPQLNKCYHVLK
jgi:2-dehydropantoate 2-reductase